MMWSVLKSEYVKIEKVGAYAKLDMNFCTNWCECFNEIRNNDVLCLCFCFY